MEESSYCPVCFGITLQLHDKAIVTLVVNKLKRDNGNFVFKAGEPHTVFLQSIETKLKEFFGWYSQFKNRSVIEEVQLITSSASCRDNCKMPPDMKWRLAEWGIRNLLGYEDDVDEKAGQIKDQTVVKEGDPEEIINLKSLLKTLMN